MHATHANTADAAAPEGAHPTVPYDAGRAARLAEAAHDPALLWVLPLGLIGGVVCAWLRFGA
jgi:hypothetical protein